MKQKWIKATATGWDNKVIREPGDVFEVPDTPAWAKGTWFRGLSPQELQRQAEQISAADEPDAESELV